jgi:hypothetical protein
VSFALVVNGQRTRKKRRRDSEDLRRIRLESSKKQWTK